MKLSNVRIAGVDYKIEWVENLNDGEHLAYGQIDYDRNIINLNSSEKFGEQQMIMTLFHEIVHGMFHHFDMEEGYNEKLVDTIARGFYMVLKDNPELLKHVT